MEELQTRLDATERRLQEASEILQAQIAERKRAEETFEKAQEYTESIVETIREPLIVLTPDLKVISANRSFYETFQVAPEETEGRFIFDVSNHQWDIPALRELLEEIIPQNTHFNNFEVDHAFPRIGRKRVLHNARWIYREGKGERIGYSSLLRTSPTKSRRGRRSKVLKRDTAASLKQPKMEY
jgi:PAS domain S-box-containing protein